MNKGESVVSYLNRIKQAIDELEVVAETIDNTELMCKSVNGFTEQWDIFIKVIIGRKCCRLGSSMERLHP